jgi:hypothetical protein
MAATPESKVKDKIKKILAENNVYYVMPIGTGYGRSGVPDFICCVDGKFLAIEAKATANDKPTALQLRELDRIEAVGGGAVVLHEGNVDGLVNVLFIMKGKMK